MTVIEYLDEWIELQRLQLQPSTWDAYRQTIASYLGPALGETALDDLDPRQLERLYVDLLDHGGRNGRRLTPSATPMPCCTRHSPTPCAQVCCRPTSAIASRSPAETRSTATATRAYPCGPPPRYETSST